MGSREAEAQDADVLVVEHPRSLIVRQRVLLAVAVGIAVLMLLVRHRLGIVGVVTLVAAPLLLWAQSRPLLRADRNGVKLRFVRFIPWRDVVSVDPPQDTGWKHQTAVLRLGNGTSEGLPIGAEPARIEQLQRWLADSRRRPSGAGTDARRSGPDR